MRTAEEGRRRIAELFGDRFDVLKMLDEDGLTETYLAVERATGDQVDIRTVVEALDDASRFRWRRNVPLVRHIRHRSFQRLRESGERGGVSYAVADHAHGTSLEAHLRRAGPIPWQEAFAITRDVADALQALHDAKLLARHLDTDRIVLAEGRAILPFDVGMHVCLVPPEGEGERPVNVGMEWVPPEMITGGPVTYASDVYLAAVLLYRMLTDRRPFSDVTSVPERLMMIVRGPRPRPSAIRSVPLFADEIVARGMAVDASDRFQTAGDLSAAIAEHL